MRTPTYEIRYFDIGSPLYIARPSTHRLFLILLALGAVFALAFNIWFESLCPNGGTMLLSTGIACAL